MKCINKNCRSKPETQVIDTRFSDKTLYTRRRRHCPRCFERFTTYEISAPDIETFNRRIEKFEKLKGLVAEIAANHSEWDVEPFPVIKTRRDGLRLPG